MICIAFVERDFSFCFYLVYQIEKGVRQREIVAVLVKIDAIAAYKVLPDFNLLTVTLYINIPPPPLIQHLSAPPPCRL